MAKTSKAARRVSAADDLLSHVHGTVTGDDGRELANAEVALWQQRIRKRVRLAGGRTSEEGCYRLSYRLQEERPGQLLVVVEARSKLLQAPLESPPTVATRDLQIDLAAQPRDRSEFATLLRAIEPLLNGLTLLDVVESDEHHDISFLSQGTAQTAEQIMRVAVAARLEEAFAVPAAAFYAFIRQRVPSAARQSSSMASS